MKIIIPDELNTTNGGVYRIIFKDGRWYVGTSSNLRKRIMSHISLFRNDFAYKGAMSCMKGYAGRIKFELVCLSNDFTERIAIERKEMRKRSKKRLNTNQSPGLKAIPPDQQTIKTNNMEKFIVAEVSKSWKAGDPATDLLSQKFEAIINVNLSRGYILTDWKLGQVCNGDVFTETIIAIFERME